MKREHLEDYVLTIPDFPQKGIMFRDITSLVQDPDGLQDALLFFGQFFQSGFSQRIDLRLAGRNRLLAHI